MTDNDNDNNAMREYAKHLFNGTTDHDQHDAATTTSAPETRAERAARIPGYAAGEGQTPQDDRRDQERRQFVNDLFSHHD